MKDGEVFRKGHLAVFFGGVWANAALNARVTGLFIPSPPSFIGPGFPFLSLSRWRMAKSPTG
jgi:hypothetical protein